ncbi:MAG TPA: hypothetical protein VII83_06605 [Gaiellaceae bacterium]|jgi:uncharacterized spore protein YtfJ
MPEHPKSKTEAPRPGRASRAVLDKASAKRVYGEPIDLDGVTIIPVAAVHRCGQQEGVEESEKGRGCSCNSARPVGLVVIRDGQVEWKPTLDVNRMALAATVALGLLVLLRRH